ncbi:hypothetical protein EGR_10373 [Echinococcus granulosus]|uniref:Uncharacterized protein n=1 Tax=Echinococcus granulosus TaxID=6210 RepID=W6UMQ7_ECHGR|nr:hypothetical protein EGR_10373 [Echinococcus granulosus]EUB54774.1 hypothetical protein EGR_10373 [Echinococcus granulosus]
MKPGGGGGSSSSVSAGVKAAILEAAPSFFNDDALDELLPRLPFLNPLDIYDRQARNGTAQGRTDQQRGQEQCTANYIEVIELAEAKNFVTSLPDGFELLQDECLISRKWCLRRFSGDHLLNVACFLELELRSFQGQCRRQACASGLGTDVQFISSFPNPHPNPLVLISTDLIMDPRDGYIDAYDAFVAVMGDCEVATGSEESLLESPSGRDTPFSALQPVICKAHSQ